MGISTFSKATLLPPPIAIAGISLKRFSKPIASESA